MVVLYRAAVTGNGFWFRHSRGKRNLRSLLMPKSQNPPLTPPEAERAALNMHGVFLKKRVIEEISRTSGMDVFAEEFGVTFNEPTAIDVIAVSAKEKQQRLFVFECKRAYAKDKTWVFFRDVDRTFRWCRVVSSIMQFGQYTSEEPFAGNPPVCSEGYELTNSENLTKANQKPIYEAGNQLSKGFLGFVRTRWTEQLQHNPMSPSEAPIDWIFPVLVTTADLCVAEFNAQDISLRSGNLERNLQLKAYDWLILKHPFSTFADESLGDFRNCVPHEEDRRHWRQVYRESLYVVNASKLPNFLTGVLLEPSHKFKL